MNFNEKHTKGRYLVTSDGRVYTSFRPAYEWWAVIGGIVLDCDVKKHLTDFHTYKWDFPVYYRIQTNRMGKINFKDFAYFKLKNGER